MTTTVISVESVSKDYRLGVFNHGTLQRDLQSWWARKRGRPDPNAEIGKAGGSAGDIFHALDDINFTVNAGETVGVIGRNGAGKSTLLKILSRVASPNAGRVRIRGRVSSLLEVGTGFHPELTGRENVFLNGAILGMTKDEIRRKFDEIVGFAEVEQFIDTPVKRYSSGMYVRLAFAVAAHLEPEILIVDEVLAVGDHEFQKKCLGRMREVRTQGRTVLFVSHNMTAINSLCTRSMLLHKGKVTADGPSAEVTREYLRSTSMDGPTHWHFAHPPEAEKVAFVREVMLVDPRGETQDGYELTEPLTVRVRYHLATELRGVSVGLQIISEDNGETLISLSDPELDITRLEARPAGDYFAEVRIPDRLLNTGAYSVRIGISRGRHDIYDVVEGLMFRIVDSVGIIQFLGFERKSSLFAVQIPWMVRRESEDRVADPQ